MKRVDVVELDDLFIRLYDLASLFHNCALRVNEIPNRGLWVRNFFLGFQNFETCSFYLDFQFSLSIFGLYIFPDNGTARLINVRGEQTCSRNLKNKINFFKKKYGNNLWLMLIKGLV